MRASLARSRRRVPKVTSAAHGPGHKMQECPIATERRHETASRLDAPAVRRTGFRQDRAGVAGRAMERGSGGLRREAAGTAAGARLRSGGLPPAPESLPRLRSEFYLPYVQLPTSADAH